MSTRFPVVSVARQYTEQADEYRGYLERKSDEGLLGQANADLAEFGVPPLDDGADRAGMLAICMERYFPHYGEAVQVITGPTREDS